MRISEPTLAPPTDCPYLDGKMFTQEYFFALGLNRRDMGELLEAGWRRFGTFFFRPRCEGCRACTPLKLRVETLELSHSQKRAQKANRETVVEVRELEYRDELFEIYEDHSWHRFAEEPTRQHFMETFFTPGAPGIQVEYRIQGRLAAVGFCDVGDQGLSSVYFVYRDEFKAYSLGTFSVEAEARIARDMGLKYYYLGYWVPGCERMEYKARFKPHLRLNWESGRWEAPEV